MKPALSPFFRSVAGKVFGILTACLVLLLLFNWLLNNVVLVHAYERERETLLVKAYTDTCEAWHAHSGLQETLTRYTADGSLSVTMWFHRQIIFTNERLTAPPAELALENGTYRLFNHTDDGRLVLYGKTADGVNLSLSVSLSQMQQGIALTNRFFGITALITLLLSCVVVFFLSRIFTRPVSRLSEMAAQMANLNFSARCKVTGTDELAALGRSLNTVSETMETTLSELKTANSRLRSDVEVTAQKNEARARFIRNVSHELKTPIALIQTYAEGLHENIADDAASRDYYCAVIEEEAQKLSKILGKLTTLMQLEAGDEELSIEHFDITALLTRLLKRYAPLFDERHVTVSAPDAAPCLVWGDGVLIETVITNYLTNALHHVNDEGRIAVTLTPTNEKTVRVAVFNTGSLIPPDDLPHLWESFYKVDKAHTRTYGGSGIGLSVVAAIMQAHQMPYGVDNSPDGVTFYIELQQ